MGDFNAHNPLWGSNKVTDKGKVVEDVLSYLNLCIQYDIYIREMVFTTIVDPSLLLDLHWTVQERICVEVIIFLSLLKGVTL